MIQLVIGIMLLSLPFVVIFIVTVKDFGFWDAIFHLWLPVIVVVTILAVGGWLVTTGLSEVALPK